MSRSRPRSPFRPHGRLAFLAAALLAVPLAGRLDYDGSIDLNSQDMVCLRAGLDFGPFCGPAHPGAE
jgi:hypothetical protein